MVTVFLFYIYCPMTNGYELIYERVIRKLLITYEKNIDKFIQMSKDELTDKYQRIKKQGVDTVIEELQKHNKVE